MTRARVPADADAVAHVFVAELGDDVTVDGDDGHHLQRVRRVRTGEAMTAADDTGRWRPYSVASVASGAVTLVATGAVVTAPEPDLDLGLAVALTKAGLDDVVAAVTELGVARITPFRADRSVVRWDDARAARAVERFRAIAREASMQSRRARIPVVDAVTDVAEIAGRFGLVVAERGGAPAGSLALAHGPVTVVVGPEGGFSPAELARFGEAPRLGIGTNVLKAATAPVAAVAAMVAAGPMLRPK
jgi:16S rRNA (uracil1498-N3)-methyltransferase